MVVTLKSYNLTEDRTDLLLTYAIFSRLDMYLLFKTQNLFNLTLLYITEYIKDNKAGQASTPLLNSLLF